MKNIGTPSLEGLSAMADGELAPAELAQALGAVVGDDDCVKRWHAYHVVGDTLRSAELAADGKDLEFLRKFEQRLALEPVYSRASSASVLKTALVGVAGSGSANASTLRWKLVAGVACSALAMVVGVGQWRLSDPQPSVQISVGSMPQPAAVAPATLVQAGAQVMIRDPELDSLLAAHQQVGGHSALQRPSGFLRNATYERPTR